MVTIANDAIIITIPTTDPADTLNRMQTGIIDLIQNMLSQGKEAKDLEISPDTAYGGYQLLKLLRETLTVDNQGKQ